MQWTVEDHLSGKGDFVRELYETFEHLVTECGPAEQSVTKTAIVFKGRVRGFAGITPRKRGLSGFLDLMERANEPPFTRATPYTQRLWVNRFFVDATDQLVGSFAVRVAQAYAVGDGAHRR
ncbi:MAG TPA: DUF5655 domain-containing protein [Acidimicrobiales bacterium]|nr:DUF5655 domain-containing protein [Acidimicrobiales bacterium]